MPGMSRIRSDQIRRRACWTAGHPEQDDPIALPQVDRDAGTVQGSTDVVLQDTVEYLAVLALEDYLAQLEQDARLGL